MPPAPLPSAAPPQPAEAQASDALSRLTDAAHGLADVSRQLADHAAAGWVSGRDAVTNAPGRALPAGFAVGLVLGILLGYND